jgi:hypothetical protein
MGREIYVPEEASISLGDVKGATVYVLLRYAEQGVDLVPVADPAEEGDTIVVPSRIEETFVLSLGPRPRAHTRRGKGWRGCGEDHPLPLARLAQRAGRWQVVGAYRRPRVD